MFLAILGHDLRNPLNAMSINAQTLARGQLDPRSRELISQFTSSASAMARMITDLLDFTAAGLGAAMPLTMGTIDLKNLCDEVVGEMRAAYPSRNFLFEHRGNLDGRGDASRLRQVVSNLLGNAVQHGGEGPVTLKIADEGPNLFMSIHNTGPAIPRESLPTIFEPLVRGFSPKLQAQRRAGSIGLGLYIAREVVQAHGGSIGVESTDEAGTTFIVRLPRVPATPR
jgi:signal transduction histidine kinase